MPDKNILITGATGLICSALIPKLISKGFTPFILSTSVSDHKKNIYKWDPVMQTCEMLPNEEFFGIINLAGAGIAETKWNKKGKSLIKQSRIGSTLYLKNIINRLPIAPKHIISVSAIGYYGLINNETKTENSANGNDFAASVCKEWEQAAAKMETTNSRVSIIRIGIVLAKRGGFYKKIRDLAKWKIAASLGAGEQPVCWIHMDDLVNIFTDILEGKIKPGIYNAVAGINSNREVTEIIAQRNGQPFVWPAIPSFMLKIMFGEKAEMFLDGPEISSSKLKEAGFHFQYSDINKAIADLAKN